MLYVWLNIFRFYLYNLTRLQLFTKMDAVFYMYPSTYLYHKEHKYNRNRIQYQPNGIFAKLHYFFCLMK